MSTNIKIKRILSLAAVLALIVMLAAATTACGNAGGSEPAETETAEESSNDAGNESGTLQVGAFETTDLQGNTVTEDILQEADLTLINYWATYCGPCYAEMPDLQALADDYEGRVTVLGVVTDMQDLKDSSLMEAAEKFTTEQGTSFTNVIPQGGLLELAYSLEYVPTTIIVDKDGVAVGSPIVGANIEGYRKVIDDYFAAH